MPICSLCDVLPEKGDCIPVLPVFITNRLAKSEFVITLVSSIYAVPLSWIPRVCVLSGDRRAVLYVDLIIASAKLVLRPSVYIFRQNSVLCIFPSVFNTNLPYKYLTSYNVPNGGTLLSEVVSAHNAGYRCFIVYAMGNVLDAPSNAYAQVRVTNGDNRYIVCEWMNDNEARGYVAKRMIDTQTMQWAGNWSVPVLNSDLIHGNTDAFSIPANSERRITVDLSRYNVGTNYRLYAVVRGSTWANVGAIYCNNNQTIIDTRNLNSTAVYISLWYTIIRK